MDTGLQLNFSTDSLLVLGLVLILTTTVPIKIGASFVGATKTSFNASGFASMCGVLSAYFSFSVIGDFFGLVAAFVSMSIIYWLVLKPSFIGSFGVTILVLLIQLAIIQAMANYGFVNT